MASLTGMIGGAVSGAGRSAGDVIKTIAAGAISRSVLASAGVAVAHGALSGAREGRAAQPTQQTEPQGEPAGGRGGGVGARASSILLRIEGILHAQEQVLGNIETEIAGISDYLQRAFNKSEDGANKRHAQLIGALKSGGHAEAKRFDQPNLLSRLMGGAGDMFSGLVKGIEDTIGGVLGGLKDLGAGLLKLAGPAGALAAAGAAGFAFGSWLNNKFGISDAIGNLLPDPGKEAGEGIKESVQTAHAKDIDKQARIDIFGEDRPVDMNNKKEVELIERRRSYLSDQHMKMRKARRAGNNISKVPEESSTPSVASKPTGGAVTVLNQTNPNVSIGGRGGGGNTTINQFYAGTPLTESAPIIAGNSGG